MKDNRSAQSPLGNTPSCGCLTAPIHSGADLINHLESIRAECPALRHLFLPDEIWSEYKTWHQEPDGVAAHRSMLLLALDRGHLARMTGQIHRYLIENGGPHPGLRRQYVKSLREKWIFYEDPLERHQTSRIFAGLVVELQFVEWLETLGWTIVGLEAFREGADIEARTVSGVTTAFEVKAVGTEDQDFKMILRSLADEPAVASVSPYVAMNYLFFRVYEAAKQLARIDGPRIAVAVIDDTTWWRFEWPLENQWIDWVNPSFFDWDAEWEAFLKGQKGRYPDLRSELGSVLRGVDEVWIVRRSSGFEYHLEYRIRARNT